MEKAIKTYKIINVLSIICLAIWAAAFLFSNKPIETIDKIIIAMLVFKSINYNLKENEFLDEFKPEEKNE
jgi:hypothetical protein